MRTEKKQNTKATLIRRRNATYQIHLSSLVFFFVNYYLTLSFISHSFVAGSFGCQTCWEGRGNTKEEALKACYYSSKIAVCNQEKPVCMVRHRDHGFLHQISRYCASKDAFEEEKQECYDECTVAMCEESGCTAELPKSGMYDVLLLRNTQYLMFSCAPFIFATNSLIPPSTPNPIFRMSNTRVHNRVLRSRHPTYFFLLIPPSRPSLRRNPAPA